MGLHFPKWGLPWECEGSLPNIFLTPSRVCDVTPGLPLGPQPCNHFCLGRKPKARVATDKNMTKFHEKTSKLHLKYLKERDKKVYKMNKNMVSVLANLSFAMCQTFIKDQIQMHSQINIFESSSMSNHCQIVRTQMKISLK